jgi:hypothetical protein
VGVVAERKEDGQVGFVLFCETRSISLPVFEGRGYFDIETPNLDAQTRSLGNSCCNQPSDPLGISNSSSAPRPDRRHHFLTDSLAFEAQSI